MIKRPKEELYAYWQNLENLHSFMSRIEKVNEANNKRSHWVAEDWGISNGKPKLFGSRKTNLLSWRSLPDSETENSGKVKFQDSGDRNSTIVEVTISYLPPPG